jgi:hypothetical protein
MTRLSRFHQQGVCAHHDYQAPLHGDVHLIMVISTVKEPCSKLSPLGSLLGLPQWSCFKVDKPATLVWSTIPRRRLEEKVLEQRRQRMKHTQVERPYHNSESSLLKTSNTPATSSHPVSSSPPINSLRTSTSNPSTASRPLPPELPIAIRGPSRFF